MTWLYLSPHLDDAAFSCGSLVWDQVRAGEAVEVWTICAGDAPPVPLSAYALSLHERWKTGVEATALRREEDRLACQRLGAGYRHFSLPDAIYRRNPQNGEPLYTSDDDLFRPLPPVEYGRIEELSCQLVELLPVDCQLVCPLTLGNHVDHQLVRAAVEQAVAEQAAAGLAVRGLWYYADLPYALKTGALLAELIAGTEAITFPVSAGGLSAWIESAAAYRSQISTFWPGVDAMKADLYDFCRQTGGIRLWRGR